MKQVEVIKFALRKLQKSESTEEVIIHEDYIIKCFEDLSSTINSFQLMENFHLRAAKLMRKKKNFLVVAEDEPYFMDVYNLIRNQEIANHTWTSADEHNYDAAKRESEK